MDGADPARERFPQPNANEWHWLWDAYVAGLCVTAAAAVALLSHRFPGNVPVATAALAGIAVATLAVGRRVIRGGYGDINWRTVTFVTTVVTLWVIAVWSSPVAVTALPAIYPLIFATLPLAAAIALTTLVNLVPLGITLLTEGTRSPNLTTATAITLVGLITAPVIGTVIVTSMRQRARLTTLVDELEASRAESARLSRAAGVATERERLAREIHDTLAQGFTSIVTLAQAVDAELDSNPVAAREHVALIRNTAKENLAEARGIVVGLTPAALDEGSLPAAIRRQCDLLSAETGINVTTVMDRPLPTLGMATDVVLLRAAQEALTNVRRHAQARDVRVELSSAVQRADQTGDPGIVEDVPGVRLALADNGVGLSENHVEGFGLRGMRARVAQVGGIMSVSPTPGGGVTIVIEVPT